MGVSPTLKIEGKDSYQTPFGGILNIFLIILSVLGTIYFGKELILKQEPQVVISLTEGHQVGPFEIRNSGFNILLSLELPNFTYYQDERIYFVNATYESTQYYENNTITDVILPLESGLCNKYFTDEEITNKFKTSLKLDTFYCVRPNQVSIEGFWGNSIYKNIRISVFTCQNSTANNYNCLPEEEISRYINGGIISIYAANPFTNYNNLDTPITMRLADIFNSINIDLTFDYVFEIQSLEFNDDQGFMLQNIKETSFPSIESVKTLYYGKRGNLISNITVEGYPYGQKINRSYNKIQDILTRIGGLLKALSIIASFLSKIYSEFQFYSDSIFNFNYQLSNYQICDHSKSMFHRENSPNKNIVENNSNFIDESKKNNQSFEKHNLIKTQNNLKSENQISNNFNNFKLIQNNNFEKKEDYVKINKLCNNNSGNDDINSSNFKNNNYIKILPNNFKEEKINSSKADVNNNSEINDIKRKNVSDNKESVNDNNNNFLNNNILSNSLNEIENPRLLSSTNKLYMLLDFTMDGISQFLHQFCCCKFKKNLITQRKNYKKKINALLSINYIFKKFYMLELLSNKILKSEDIINLDNNYISQLARSEESNENYDDNNKFIC